LDEKANITAPPGTLQPGDSGLQRLVRNAIAGKRHAQKEIYDRYAPLIYGIIRRYIKDEAAAGEILNDAFFKILTRLDSYGFKGAIEGWMRTIAVHTITDHVRKNLRYNEAINRDIAQPDTGSDQEITARIAYKDLLALVHDLPDTHRMVFNLFVFEDLAHRDISKLLGISENNSRWHLNDARRRLKEKITLLM
jgi:RNA polymerase sigma-70 factor (ECF subfamily)